MILITNPFQFDVNNSSTPVIKWDFEEEFPFVKSMNDSTINCLMKGNIPHLYKSLPGSVLD